MLQGKVAVVTGGSRGIGAEIALLLAEHGAGVVLLARDARRLEEAAQKVRALGARALTVACDVGALDQIPSVMSRILTEFGRIDVWVNNAGVSQNIAPEDITPRQWDELMDINLKSVFFWSQAAYGVMKKQGGGRLVHISSVGGQRGARWNGLHYVASKGGLIALSKGFALSGAQYHILSNAVCPGLIETDMARDLGFAGPEAARSIPLARLGTGRDVAGAVLYLASPLADYVTGATIDVNGGWYLR